MKRHSWGQGACEGHHAAAAGAAGHHVQKRRLSFPFRNKLGAAAPHCRNFVSLSTLNISSPSEHLLPLVLLNWKTHSPCPFSLLVSGPSSSFNTLRSTQIQTAPAQDRMRGGREKQNCRPGPREISGPENHTCSSSQDYNAGTLFLGRGRNRPVPLLGQGRSFIFKGSWSVFNHHVNSYLIPGEGKGNPLQYSCLGNPMDRGAWWAAVHGVTKESDVTEWLNNDNRLFQWVLHEHLFYLAFNFVPSLKSLYVPSSKKELYGQ